MSGEFYTKAPHANGHTHFANNHIAGFPDVHGGPSFDQRENFVR